MVLQKRIQNDPKRPFPATIHYFYGLFERLMSDIISDGYANHFVQTRASVPNTQNQVELGPEIELGPEDPPKWPFPARIHDVTDFLSISRVIL